MTIKLIVLLIIFILMIALGCVFAGLENKRESEGTDIIDTLLIIFGFLFILGGFVGTIIFTVFNIQNFLGILNA